MTSAQLQSRCDYWKSRLNLKEWRIKIRWATKDEAKTNQGACNWSAEELTAEIYIDRKTDIESTVIHELIHPVLDGHMPNGDWKYDVHIERAINRLAAALVADV